MVIPPVVSDWNEQSGPDNSVRQLRPRGACDSYASDYPFVKVMSRMVILTAMQPRSRTYSVLSLKGSKQVKSRGMVGSADMGIKRVGLNPGAAGTYGYGDF